MNKVRWGVLSTANIGTQKVIPAMQRGKYSEITGIASRNLVVAESAARELGIPKAYASYQTLLDDPEIDAVYNPLPNHLHVPWSVKVIGQWIVDRFNFGVIDEVVVRSIRLGSCKPESTSCVRNPLPCLQPRGRNWSRLPDDTPISR